ncbi:FIG00952406: hypothetical protein [Pseudoalteromonas luteoviolacea B = ATCC 29581]|nr:FIG00952406: hypothetical protein [Pseudoalteromonas luteoviolacea B = ATCC 29581]
MRRVIVIGAGWLGEPLCEYFLKHCFEVQGTRREVMDKSYMRRCRYVMETDRLEYNFDLMNAYWVCAIPPRASDPNSTYLAMLAALLQEAKMLQCKGFVLCSSTGVYSVKQGTYREDSQLADKKSLRVCVLQEAEELVLKSNGKVLRLAGLVGPKREPGHFTAGKMLSSSSQSLVNMVHRDDVIEAIAVLLSNYDRASSIYNVCYPAHPTRSEYYKAHCKTLGTSTPTFASNIPEKRIIDGSLLSELGFQYRHPI